MNIIATFSSIFTYQAWQDFAQSLPCQSNKYVGYSFIALSALGVLSTGVLFFASAVVPGVAALVASIALGLLGTNMIKERTAAPSPHLPLSQTSNNTPTQTPSVLSIKIKAALSALAVHQTQHCSSLSVNDRIKGSVMGQSIGDALGLLTEFTSRAQAQSMIQGRDLEYALKEDSAFVEGPSHSFRSRFLSGSFTDDTEQACALVRAIDQKKKGAASSLEQLYAQQLLHWRNHGLDDFYGQYASLEDPHCRDVGTLTQMVLSHPDFSSNPHQASLDVWRQCSPLTALRPASNGAVMRSSFAALIYHRDLAKVIEKTILFAKVTHSDPRCVAASVALTTAIALFLNGYDSVDEVLHHATEIAKAVLRDELQSKIPELNPNDNWQDLYQSYAQNLEEHLKGDFGYLQLDQGNIGFAYKCTGAAFHALRLARDYSAQNAGSTYAFRKAIQDVVSQGGDADTNAAPSAALIGACFGINSIPVSWRNNMHPQAKYVLEQTNHLIETLSSDLNDI